MATDAPGPRGGADPGAQGSGRRRRLSPEQLRLIGIGALAALVILFAVLNLDRVSVNWIVTTTRTPLTVVIAVAFVVGGLVGALIARPHRRRKA